MAQIVNSENSLIMEEDKTDHVLVLPPNPNSRYIHRYFLWQQQCYYAMIHINGIVIVGLAPNHAIFTHNNTIDKIKFCTTESGKSAILGKRKKAAAQYNSGLTICAIQCENNINYNFSIPFKCKIMEFNNELLTQPNLAKTDAENIGWIALVHIIKHNDLQEIINSLPQQPIFSSQANTTPDNAMKQQQSVN
jgi:hypothetical protein